LKAARVSVLRRAIAEFKQRDFKGDQKFIISSSSVLRKAR
jgi:hypothetical protein